MRAALFSSGAILALSSCALFAADGYALIPGGTFQSVLPPSKDLREVTVAPFQLAQRPVTQKAFAQFLKRHPEWRRGAAPPVFVDERYLDHWTTAGRPVPGTEQQPVTRVSWFAAQAYCEEQGKRLPTWYEWEFAAAADAKRADAREDPQWRQRILDWYARPSDKGLPETGSTPANYYGVQDLHGVVWEWVGDFAGMMVSGDNREQGDPDLLKYCGAGALSMEQKENYAVLMRVAMLSSLEAAYTTGNLGFRCAMEVVP